MIKHFIAAFFIFLSLSYAQWKYITPLPTVKNTNKIFALNENLIFVTCNNGIIYKSTNKGIDWQTIQTSTKSDLFDIAFFSNGTGLILSENGMLFRSTDHGDSWTETNVGEDVKSYSLSIDKNDRAWISSENGNLFYSTNKGISWSKISTGFNYNITKLKFTSSLFGYAIASNSTSTIFLKTRDAGLNWESQTLSQNFNNFAFINDSTLLIGGNSSILKSTNFGKNWFEPKITRTVPLNVNAIQLIDENNGYIASYNTILRTSDSGDTWNELQLRHDNNFLDLSFSNLSTGYCIDFNGTIFSTTNEGKTWSLRSGKMNGVSIRSFTEDRVITLSDNTISLDSGNSWSMYMGDRSLFPQSDSKGALWGFASFGNYKGDLLKSTDNGKNWEVMASVIDNIWGIYLASDNVIYVNVVGPNNGHRLYRYSDLSKNLKHVLTYDPYVIKLISLNVSALYLLCTNRIYISYDSGNSWSSVNFSAGELKDIVLGKDGTIYILTKGNQILKSADGGNNWITQDFNTSEKINGISFGLNKIWLYGDNGTLIYNISDNLVESKSLVPNNINISQLIFSDTKALVSGNRGELILADSLLSFLPGWNNNELPQKFALYQNFPNPFNKRTSILFDVFEKSFVNLSVYDILGRNIETLVNEEKEIGKYSVFFDSKRFASGIYFYKLTTNRYTESKKMVLLK